MKFFLIFCFTHSNIDKFEALLNEYFRCDKPHIIGLAAVNYSADQLHLSPNYFGDVVKKETCKSPFKYISLKVMDIAKERVLDTSRSISEVARELGFKYLIILPRHSKSAGYMPVEYRSLS
ncbi:helix-turn-helix domain-containing protein [Mucilaginibacter sp. Mucisp86]|uniref:helix-turn-helix domain-containing protein n=1 Tax=Mucilaginibacter sp. Mucisp86 TaxID=3243060 RepID=UPI0039B3CE9A